VESARRKVREPARIELASAGANPTWVAITHGPLTTER
jgi:hypothetical protein